VVFRFRDMFTLRLRFEQFKIRRHRDNRHSLLGFGMGLYGPHGTFRHPSHK
jgi:hypothetical protein